MRSCLLFALLLFAARAAVAAAQPVPRLPSAEEVRGAPVDIRADTIEYDHVRQLYVGRGNVRIVQPGRSMSADWVAFSEATRQGIASGNVVLVEGGDTLTASFVQFDVDSLQGVVYDGRLDAQASRFKMEGREVRKTGEQTYVFEEAAFTTCRCPDPTDRDPWQIRADRADLEIGGYGTARNSTFEVLGVPVVWLPWMIYPLKTERETGFLLPTFGASSRSGGDVALPFFWAVADNVGATLTPAYLFKRGFKPSADLEYVFGEDSEGALHGSFLHDREVDRDDPSTDFDPNRWALAWRHDQGLPEEVRLKVDLQLVSDNSYPFDFQDMSQYRTDRFLESNAFLTRHFGASERFGLVGGVRWADDLQSPDHLDRDRVLLQRLPDVALQALPSALLEDRGWVGALGAQYTYFRAQRGSPGDEVEIPASGGGLFFDTGIDGLANARERDASGVEGSALVDNSGDDGLSEGDGRFQEGEPLADRGHRLRLTPRLGYPTRLADVLEVYPELGWHETLYASRARGFEERGMVTARVDLRTRLRRRFELPFGVGSALHLMEPRFGYGLVQSVSQSEHPLFVPGTAFPQQRVRQFDLDNVTLDPADRVAAFHGVTLGLGNRFYGRGVGEAAESRLLAELSLSSQFEFPGSEFGSVYFEGIGYPGGGFATRFNVGFDPDDARFDEALLQLRYAAEAGHELRVGYRYLREIPRFFEDFPFDDDRFERFESEFRRVNQIGFGTRIALTRSWALTYDALYTLESSVFLDNAAGVEFISKCRCWAVRVALQDDRQRGFDVRVQYRLIGLGDDRARPFEAHGGAVRRSVGLLDAPGVL